MITAITLQFMTNKKFLNPSQMTSGLYGERSIPQLYELIERDIAFLETLKAIVADLMKDLAKADILAVIETHIGPTKPQRTSHTKKKRTYSVGGCLTIHEEDFD